MLRIVLLSALAALGAAQSYNNDPKNAAILAEERYLRTNGQFGAAYQQEDGVQFKEESDADGTRRGSYSYVDPSGVRRTISYTAGKDGFQPTGDHIPAAPAPVVNPLPQYNSPVQPQTYNAPVRTQAYNSPVDEDDGQWRDDTRQEYQPNSPPQWSNQAAPQTWTNQVAPQTYQAADQTWTNPQTYASVQAQWNSNPTPQPQWNPPAPTAAPVYSAPNTQRWSAPIETTPAPHRFFPPGKLSLNRSPEGFSYTFNKS